MAINYPLITIAYPGVGAPYFTCFNHVSFIVRLSCRKRVLFSFPIFRVLPLLFLFLELIAYTSSIVISINHQTKMLNCRFQPLRIFLLPFQLTRIHDTRDGPSGGDNVSAASYTSRVFQRKSSDS